MKLVGEARKVGVNLAVADIFRRETLVVVARQEGHTPWLTWMPVLGTSCPE